MSSRKNTRQMQGLWRKQICEHSRERSVCRECGGGSICQHDNVRSRCKQCKGGAICPHNKMKRDCKGCGGAGICIHGNFKRFCKDCGGPALCQHNTVCIRCKICRPLSLCRHKVVRRSCLECAEPQHHRVKTTRRKQSQVLVPTPSMTRRCKAQENVDLPLIKIQNKGNVTDKRQVRRQAESGSASSSTHPTLLRRNRKRSRADCAGSGRGLKQLRYEEYVCVCAFERVMGMMKVLLCLAVLLQPTKTVWTVVQA